MQKSMSRTRVIVLIVAAILLLCILSGGIVFAKYILQWGDSDGVVVAKNFYFTSNFLDGESHTLAPGSTSVTFTVGNHEDDLRYSEVNINYTVTVDNGATIAESTGTGTLAKDVVKDAEITISDLLPGKTYNVTVTGTSDVDNVEGGYSKTLTATIVIPANEAKLYYHLDNSAGAFIILTVWNEGDKEGSVTVTYTGIPDNTNTNMTDWATNDASKSVNIGPHQSQIFRFFGGTVTVVGAEEKALS